MLGEVQGIVVSVPGEEAAVAELGGEFERGAAWFATFTPNFTPNFNPNCQRGAALVEAGGIGNAVDFEAGDGDEAGDELLEQRALVFMDGCVGGFDRGSSFAQPARRGG